MLLLPLGLAGCAGAPGPQGWRHGAFLVGTGFLLGALAAWYHAKRARRRGAGAAVPGPELAQTSRALAESSAQNRALLNAVPDLIFLNHRDGEYLAVHTAETGKLIVPPEKFLHRNMRDFLPAPVADRFAKAFAEAQDLDAVQEFEYVLTLGDREHAFEARVAPCTEDTLLTIVRDITKRRQAETVQRDLSRFLRETQAIAGLGSYTTDLVAGRWESSEILDEIFGIDAAYDRSVPGWLALVHPSDRAMMADYLTQEVVGRGAPFDREYRIVRAKDGSEGWVHGRGRLEFDAAGRPIRLIGTIQDITGRKRVEQSLKESEERFNMAFQFSPVALGITTVETGRFLAVNQAFESLYGYTCGELEGRNAREVGIWVNAEDRAQALAVLSSDRTIRNLEVQIRRKDGDVRWVSYSGELVNMNGVPCLLSGAVDITTRKQAEAGLIESEVHLRTIIENEPECIKILDAEGCLRQMNPAGLAMIEADSFEQVAGLSVLGIVAPEYRQAFSALNRHVISGGSGHLEFEIVGLKGGHRWLETHAVPMQDKGATVLLGVTRDITERKRAEADKVKLEAQLHQAQKMESLGSLAGGVAHDMNNVLGAILGLASANVESTPEGSQVHRAFQTIITAAERGGTMVKSLLNLARQNPVEDAELDLNTIIEEEVRLLEHTTLAKIRLEMHLAPDLRPIRGDASALSHAFMNLCVNSVDAMPEGGTLTLRTRNVDRHRVEVRVEDTGCGMSREVLEQAMDPFFTTKGVGKGTGLGLSMVYSTLKAHRGDLELASEPGQGTRVSLLFPAAETGQPAGGSELDGQATLSQRHLDVLLVDDDELIQSSLQAVLEAMGHRATMALSGEEALRKLESGFQPDVVILDLNMPGLGGHGTLPRLRTLQPRVPVLLATGRADQLAMALVAAHPHVTLLPKPFSMGDLRRHLQSLGGVAAGARPL